MALATRFNPPPNWPPAPPGWVPPAGWEPDPAWGEPPEGWPLFVKVRANPRAWAYAGICAAAWLVLTFGIGSVLAGGPSAYAFGGILFNALVAWIVTGGIAWASKTRWAVIVYPAVAAGVVAALSLLNAAGRSAGG